MKAAEITEAGKEALLSRKFDMVRMNYANPDMVLPPPPLPTHTAYSAPIAAPCPLPVCGAPLMA